jgi:hypothetical protein
VINVVGIAARVWTLFPLGLALLMFVVTPTYFRPMWSSSLGIGLLVGGLVLVGGGYGATELAVRWMKRGGWRLGLGITVIVVAYFVQFVTLWIILLGPALLILLSPRQP